MNNYILRDNKMNLDFYLDKLDKIDDNIKRFKGFYNEGKVKAFGAYYLFMSEEIIDKIKLLYVIGEPKEKLKQLAEEYIEYINLEVEHSKLKDLTYNQIVCVLSLGYLFNMDKSKLYFIKENMIKENYIDARLDLLRNKIFNDKVLSTKDYYFKDTLGDKIKKDTGDLMNAITTEDKSARNSAFKDYLEKEKTKFYNRYCNDLEKRGLNNNYCGSFDYVLTAISKILDIDRGILKESKFIAFDLL